MSNKVFIAKVRSFFEQTSYSSHMRAPSGPFIAVPVPSDISSTTSVWVEVFQLFHAWTSDEQGVF